MQKGGNKKGYWQNTKKIKSTGEKEGKGYTVLSELVE